MTPLPKRRHSTRRKGKRRAAIKVTIPKFLTCPNCGAIRMPHRACENCGYYAGRPVIVKKEKKAKKKT